MDGASGTALGGAPGKGDGGQAEASAWRSEFPDLHSIYLDAAYMHPLSRGARAAIERYVDFRSEGANEAHYDLVAMREKVLRLYAGLIGADESEVSFVGSTMAGENLVLNSLGLSQGRGRVVTDSLHFFGSLYLYEQLRSRGTEVEILPARDGRIDMEDLARALERPADLVALSLVSQYNGFRHDLDEVCRLAHAAGAAVYADIIQAAGAVPFDVRSSKVDFCAGATYKWLMGDFGLGFLYVRRDRQTQLDPDSFGYRQLSTFSTNPDDRPPVRWQRRDDAAGLFMVGTPANGVVALLEHSLSYILGIGVEAIAAHRAPLLEQLRSGLDERGVPILTPPCLGTPILAFAPADAAEVAAAFKANNIFASFDNGRFRVAPSLYNDGADIERLLGVLSAA